MKFLLAFAFGVALEAAATNEDTHGVGGEGRAHFPSLPQTLAYVDILKRSNFSDWRSVEEVAKKAAESSCPSALNTSVLTALYLLGLFNLCLTSPLSCCYPGRNERTRREAEPNVRILPLTSNWKQNFRGFSIQQISSIPRVRIPSGTEIRVNVSVVEQVKKLWSSNPRLYSNVSCGTSRETLRSSFISLSGLASGIILTYSVARINDCYPIEGGARNQIWTLPIPERKPPQKTKALIVKSLPASVPVPGEDDPSDGCERTSVRLKNGLCAAIFSSWACSHKSWVLLNKETGKGECVPKLCGQGKVFVEEDQLCHDVNQEGLCPEEQRLFLTAWGETVCDCRDGMFFGPDGNCHRVYERDYCYKGTVLQFHKSSGTLLCKVDPCRKLNNFVKSDGLPFAEFEESCFQFGSKGPCDSNKRFGFDVEELRPSCVSLEEAGLRKPQRSYQYSYMSFSSKGNKRAPHYEVSYVILNGTTWELKMSPFGRQKRDLSGSKFSKNSSFHGNQTLFDSRRSSRDTEDVNPMKFQIEELLREEESVRTNFQILKEIDFKGILRTYGLNVTFLPNLYELNLSKRINRRNIFKNDEPTLRYIAKLNNLIKINKLSKQKRSTNENNEDFHSNRNRTLKMSNKVTNQDFRRFRNSSKSSRRNLLPRRFGFPQNKTRSCKDRSRKKIRHLKNLRNCRKTPKFGESTPTYRRRNRSSLTKTKNCTQKSTSRNGNKIKHLNGTSSEHFNKLVSSEEYTRSPVGKQTNINEGIKPNKTMKVRHRHNRKRRRRRKNRRKRKHRHQARVSPHTSLKESDLQILKVSNESKLTNKTRIIDSKKPPVFSGSPTSLSDFLKNRGRRTTWSRRLPTLTPGIINAPLLNQCRPGAKRDFNGHCRPKVIPALKGIKAGPKYTTAKPSSPKIKCRKNERLDSRGRCRETQLGLG